MNTHEIETATTVTQTHLLNLSADRVGDEFLDQILEVHVPARTELSKDKTRAQQATEEIRDGERVGRSGRIGNEESRGILTMPPWS
jgi:hypothetical protein